MDGEKEDGVKTIIRGDFNAKKEREGGRMSMEGEEEGEERKRKIRRIAG